jgi:septal ring factor EnvC (AmiA/AmiB activator)
MELEEQNAILSKHIDSLNSAISKFEDDKTQSEQDIKILEPFLESFHEFLSRRLSKSRILDTNTQLKETNIKELLDKLSTSCDETMMLKLKRVLNELDYPQ